MFKFRVTDPLCKKMCQPTACLKYNSFHMENGFGDTNKRYFYYYAIATAFLKGP